MSTRSFGSQTPEWGVAPHGRPFESQLAPPVLARSALLALSQVWSLQCVPIERARAKSQGSTRREERT